MMLLKGRSSVRIYRPMRPFNDANFVCYSWRNKANKTIINYFQLKEKLYSNEKASAFKLTWVPLHKNSIGYNKYTFNPCTRTHALQSSSHWLLQWSLHKSFGSGFSKVAADYSSWCTGLITRTDCSFGMATRWHLWLHHWFGRPHSCPSIMCIRSWYKKEFYTMHQMIYYIIV